MDVVYRVGWRAEDQGLQKTNSQSVSSCAAAWSSQNMIAFVFKLPTKFLSPECKETIIITSPDEPWAITRISSLHSHPVSILLWDNFHCRLLSIDLLGHCCVWSTKESFVNLWQLKWELPSPTVAPSQPLAALWLHQVSAVSVAQPFSNWAVGDEGSKPVMSNFKRFPSRSLLPFRATGWLLALKCGKVKLCVVKNCTVVTSSLQLVSTATPLEAADLAIHSDGTTIAAVAPSCRKIQVFRLSFEASTSSQPHAGNIVMSSELLSCIDTTAATCPKHFIGAVSWMRLYCAHDDHTLEMALGVSDDSTSIVYRWLMSAAKKISVSSSSSSSTSSPPPATAAAAAAAATAATATAAAAAAAGKVTTAFSSATAKQVSTICTHHYDSGRVLCQVAIATPSYVPATTSLITATTSSNTSMMSSSGTSSAVAGGRSDSTSSACSDRGDVIAAGQSVCLGNVLACVGHDGTVTLLERSTLAVISTSAPLLTASRTTGAATSSTASTAATGVLTSSSSSSPTAACTVHPAVLAFSPSQSCLALVTFQGSLTVFHLAKSLLPSPMLTDVATVQTRANYIVQMLARCLFAGHNSWDVLTLAICAEDGPLLIESLLLLWDKLRPFCTSAALERAHIGLNLDILRCSSTDSHRQASVHVHAELLVVSFMTWVQDQLQVKDERTSAASSAAGSDVGSSVDEWAKTAELCRQSDFLPVTAMAAKLNAKLLTLQEDTLASICPILHGLLIYVLRLSQPAYCPLSVQAQGDSGTSVTQRLLHKLRHLLLLVHVWTTSRPGILSFLSSIAGEHGVSILFKQISKLYLQRCQPPADVTDMEDDGIFIAAPQLLTAPPVASRHGYHALVHHQTVSGCRRRRRRQDNDTDYCFHFTWTPPCLDISSNIGEIIQDPLAASSLRPPQGLAPLQESRLFPVDVIQHMTLEAAHSNKAQKPKYGLRQCSRCDSHSALLPFLALASASSWLDSWSHSCICGGRWKHIVESTS